MNWLKRWLHGPFEHDYKSEKVIVMTEFLCKHGSVDHTKSSQLKRISQHANRLLTEEYGYVFDPRSMTDVDAMCHDCIREEFERTLCVKKTDF
jgi:hypothetical protein